MKPIGKALKIANHNNQCMQDAIDILLTAYRATPHSATGVPPGDYLFRHGYHSDFPRQELNEKEIAQARQKDQHQRDARQNETNSSSRVQLPNFTIGQRVLLRNHQKKGKLDPLYEPYEFDIENLERNGLIAVNRHGT